MHIFIWQVQLLCMSHQINNCPYIITSLTTDEGFFNYLLGHHQMQNA
jgi:hypothetical protein